MTGTRTAPRESVVLRGAGLLLRPIVVSSLLALTPVVLGCPGFETTEGEVVGREGVVVFTTETALAFSQRLVVGSTFVMNFRAKDAEETSLGGAVLRSSDEAVIAVDNTRVTLVGPGTAEVEVVVDGAVVDAVPLSAGIAGATTLVDGGLFTVATAVDARLPSRFALRAEVETELLVAAVDRCGGELLDLHASSLEVPEGAAVEVAVEDGGPARFLVTAQQAGEVELTLRTPELPALLHDVIAIEPSQVDEVQPAASAVDGNAVSLWGRAFVDDVEVIGALDFSWIADPRVTLSAAQGPVVTATVSFPLEGELPDDRPTGVQAEIFGESGSLELLTASVVSSRGAPARELPEDAGTAAPGAGCAGGGGCDPEAAALVMLLGLHRLRRLRSRIVAASRDARG